MTRAEPDAAAAAGAPPMDIETADGRALPPSWTTLAMAFGALVSLGHVFFAFFPWLSELERNILHFASFALLAALWYPVVYGGRLGAWARESASARWIDLGLGLAIAAAAIHLAFAENAIYARGVKLSTLDWIAGGVVILGGMELTRRVAGWIIPILVALALSYVTWWGAEIGGVFAFAGLSPETVLFRSLYNDEGMFGAIARISSTLVFLFILFGAFLVRSGAGEFVIELARAVAGRVVGGPGLVAVIASGLTGTISGSAVANTASTGVVTIPLMKRAGFSPHFAGGVEAAASTGGQLMPPIMGAGAFVMASYTQIPYETIVAVAALPALLYFASVAMFVRIEAKRLGIAALGDEQTSLVVALRERGASFLIPIAVLITLLVVGFTPTYAAVIGIGAVIASSWLTKTPMGPRAIFEALALGARNMVMTAVLLCTVGLVVNVIATAGVGNTFSLMISDWAKGDLLIAIVLIALASLVLGMGLPVTAAYIVLATLSAPALAGMIGDAQVAQMLAAGGLDPSLMAIVLLGAPDAAATLAGPMTLEQAQSLVASLPLEIRAPLREQMLSPAVVTTALLSAHMIIFWLSQDSNVTPPVCLAAFTAAAIAKAPAFRTGLAAWKLAKGLYIVPVLFAYTPFLAGDALVALQIFFFALVGVYGLAGAIEGWLEGRLSWVERAAVGAAGVATMWPDLLLANIVGAAIVIGVFTWSARRSSEQAERLQP